MRLVMFGLFVATVVAANFAVKYIGIVPVGFGLMAPAGAYFAGASFSIRDGLHRSGGRAWVACAVITGSVLSLATEGMEAIAIASACAFVVSELSDMLVYERISARNVIAGIAASNVVGAAVDSVLFLMLAFGSLEFFPGQFVAKVATTIPVIAALWLWRHRAFLPRHASA